MFLLLEGLAGILVALLLLRAGMPSIFPLLIWIPLLWVSPSWLFLIGFVSASLAWEARAFSYSSSFFPREWIIGWIIAFAGLASLVIFDFSFSTLTPFLVPILLFSLLALVFRSVGNPFIFVSGLILVLLVGWFGLHVWVVPFALPALLLGFLGSLSTPILHPSANEPTHPIRDSVLGVFSGLLPGIGPGLITALWLSDSTSPSLRVSNLVFSLGLVSISGAVRSYPAGILSSFPLPSWEWILVYILACFFLAFGLSFLFTFSFSLSPFFFFVLHSFLLFLLGGFSTLLLILLAYSISRLLLHFHLPLSLCSLCLVPSILWFYYSF